MAQSLLHAVELVLADDGRDPRDRDPFGRVRDPLGASAAADGEQGGAARLGGPRAQAVAEHLAEIDRVGQHAAQGGGAPVRAPPGGGDPEPAQALHQGRDGHALVGVPGEEIADHRRLRLVQPHAGRVPRAIRVEPVAVGRPRPGQQGAGAQLAQAATAHALGDQRAFVLGHRAPDLQQQLIVRVTAHRPVEELDLRPVLLQLLDQEHLMDVVAGQAVRRGDQDAIQPGARRGVAQAVQAGAAQRGPAATVVAEDALGRQGPAPRRGVGTQPLELLFSRLRLGLALGRYPSIGGYSHGGSPREHSSERRRRPGLDAWWRPAGAAGRRGPTFAAPPGGRPGAA